MGNESSGGSKIFLRGWQKAGGLRTALKTTGQGSEVPGSSQVLWIFKKLFWAILATLGILKDQWITTTKNRIYRSTTFFFKNFVYKGGPPPPLIRQWNVGSVCGNYYFSRQLKFSVRWIITFLVWNIHLMINKEIYQAFLLCMKLVSII